MYQDSSTRHDWPVKKAVQCPFANQDERKIETLFRYLVESVGSENTNLGAASQTLLTDVLKITSAAQATLLLGLALRAWSLFSSRPRRSW